MIESLHETLTRISKLKTKKEKVEALRTDHSLAMETLVNCCFNPNIIFKLPEGEPPYRPMPKAQGIEGTIYHSSTLRLLRLFVNNPDYEHVKDNIRETRFIELLESIDPDDAKLLVSIKDKKMPIKGITKSLFEEAWPALASTWVKKEEN